jgi:hypothetical protein
LRGALQAACLRAVEKPGRSAGFSRAREGDFVVARTLQEGRGDAARFAAVKSRL